MQSEDARYLKRKIRSRSIDVHPTEEALVVNYELEALILGDLGDPLLGDKKECQKIIRLKSLNEDTDCGALAREVVEKCSLIHPSKLEEVEQLIYYLQKRRDSALVNGNPGGDSPRPDSAGSGTESPVSGSSCGLGPERANINSVESYVELLYEGLPEKVKGSALILQLARNPDNLEELANNEAVLSALARVLREDWRKSIELSTNLVYVFFCFSTYSQFHPVILQYKVGSLCMDVVDHELRRHDQLREDLELHRRRCESSQSAPLLLGPLGDVRTTPEGPPRRRDGVSLIPRRMVESAGTDIRDRKKAAEGDAARDEYDKTRCKFRGLVRRQDQLLRVSFYLLMNIAEDSRVENKMRKKNMVGLLAKSLDRDNPDLLVLVVTFLKKLSIFRENVDDLADLNVVEKLPRVLTINQTDLVHATLKLLFNLTFDTSLRDRMVRVGFLPKVVSLLNDQNHRPIVLKILYHLSVDDRCKSMFTYTDCIPMVMSMLLDIEDEEPAMELVALSINLAINKRNAELMTENGWLQRLVARAFTRQDPLLMKVVRNVAEHDGAKRNLIEFVGDIAKATVDCSKEDFVVECVGVLANMTLPELDYQRLIQAFNLIPWVLSTLVPGKHEDDLVLEVVVLLGTAAADEGCTKLLCKADILLSLIELLKAKQEDDEMVLQIIFVFYQVLRHAATREYLIKETEAPAYLIDLMHDKNTHIRRVCNSCLDIIADCDVEWANRIRLENFRWHNSQWLEMVESSSLDLASLDTHREPPDPQDPDSEFIQNTLLFPTGPCKMSLDDCDDDVGLIGSTGSVKDVESRPKSSRYSRDLESEFGDRREDRTAVLTPSLPLDMDMFNPQQYVMI